MRANKGLALIVVLWVLTLLTIMASSFALTIQRESAIISAHKESAMGLALAEAGVNYAILMLLNTNEMQRWQANHSLYEIEFAEKRIRILIADEAGKINLNKATKEQLRQLLNPIVSDRELADSLSDAIIDWRDSDDIKRLKGAEKDQYAAAGLTYKPRNNAFESIEELQMVMGMNADIYQKLAPMLTVYSTATGIYAPSASREILLSLPDVSADQVDAYLLQRAEQQRNAEPVTVPNWANTGGTQSKVYGIYTEVMIAKGVTETMRVIMRQQTARNGLPYQLLKWDKGYTMPSLFTLENDAMVVN